MSRELEKLRQKIDDSDRDIIEALANRMKVVEEVRTYKKANNMDAFDEERQQDVLSTRVAWGRSRNLSANFIRELFERILRHALEIERK